jgi:hypothetical protein
MKKATAELENNGLIKTHGNSYSDALFQNTGTGTYRIENSGVNTSERQFIQGSFAVRGGQAEIPLPRFMHSYFWYFYTVL